MIPETTNPDGTGWHLRNIIVLCAVLATLAVCVVAYVYVSQHVSGWPQ